MIHTTEYMNVLLTEEKVTVERQDKVVLFSIVEIDNRFRVTIPLSLMEAEELRDMLTRALENAEDVRVVES